MKENLIENDFRAIQEWLDTIDEEAKNALQMWMNTQLFNYVYQKFKKE